MMNSKNFNMAYITSSLLHSNFHTLNYTLSIFENEKIQALIRLGFKDYLLRFVNISSNTSLTAAFP